MIFIAPFIESRTLQESIAASFDKSPDVFKGITQGIKFTLIELDVNLCAPATGGFEAKAVLSIPAPYRIVVNR